MKKDKEREQLIKAYTTAPGLLARQLADIFGICKDFGQMAIHNKAVQEIQTLTGGEAGRKQLLNEVAEVILKVASLK
jgi:butyrate kinase